MFRTKSVADPISKKDGLRLFVTRYWPQGHSRDECDEWIPSVAPSQRLLKQFQHGKIEWSEFRAAYTKEIMKGYHNESALNPKMRNSGQKYFLKLLRHLGQTQTITLICTCAPDEEHCHRHILRDLLSD
jgi:uncharacterized protein YeaO (DUF488 family)